MPEPNLPPLHVHVDENTENKYNLVDATVLRKQLPEMPQDTRDRLLTDFGLPKVHLQILVVSIILQ